ncbi:hypothetical protein [Methylobacter sp. BBA5.1]|uniref:hypothetical protein n=1 Tax=Methylobacter sp. BBA5.1 TaxID=1495064 RepID=UPI00055A3179|nr:hypothetical protein [Methylobacter sp. BBA5.1]
MKQVHILKHGETLPDFAKEKNSIAWGDVLAVFEIGECRMAVLRSMAGFGPRSRIKKRSNFNRRLPA